MNLNKIFEPVANELQHVKQYLKEQLDTLHSSEPLSDDEKNHAAKVIDYFFAAPGKGLRPALVLLAAQLAASKGTDAASSHSHAIIQLATIVELFHSASLVHDDVVDRAQYRRQQVSLNEKHGDHIAVIVGDGLILQAFYLLFTLDASPSRKEQVFRIIRHTLQRMCLGELCAHRLLTTHDTAELDEYIRLVERKTATMMSACCECSAILIGNTPDIQQKMADFGTYFGIAFQVADDLRDQDALLKQGIELVPLINTYAQKARNELSIFPESPSKRSLMTVCGMLLPTQQFPGMFVQESEGKRC